MSLNTNNSTTNNAVNKRKPEYTYIADAEWLTSERGLPFIIKFGSDGIAVYTLLECYISKDPDSLITEESLDGISFLLKLPKERIQEILLFLEEKGRVTKIADSTYSIDRIAKDKQQLQKKRDIYRANALGQPSNCSAIAQQLPEQLPSESIQNNRIPEDQNNQNIKNSIAPENLEFPPELDFPECREAVQKFIDHRKRIKKPIKTLESLQATLRKWSKFGSKNFIESVENSISNEWQGLFEPKGAGPPGPKLSLVEQKTKKLFEL